MARKYFARANTSSGCVNLIDSNLKNMSVCAVGGKSKTAKSRLMKTIASHFEANGENVEYIISPFDIKRCEGIVIRSIKFAMADDETVDLSPAADTDEALKMRSLEISSDYLNELEERRDENYRGLYEAYEKAKKIHDEWEKIYIANMDFDRLSAYGSGITQQLIGREGEKGNTVRTERFFGASTPDGSVNYIDNLTEGLERRYFIKGRPGTGKSTYLKRLAKAAEISGYDIEVYYCSFDKNSLDMVLVPELGFCVFDSTAPHELFPCRPGDSILDFYTEGGLTGIDEKFDKQLEHIRRRYSFRVCEGTSKLRTACCFDAEREYYLERITDNDEISKMADKIVRRIIN